MARWSTRKGSWSTCPAWASTPGGWPRPACAHCNCCGSPRRYARDAQPGADRGTLCTNPPYGERIGGQPLQLAGFYRGLGEAFRRFHGWDLLVLSGNPLLERNLGVRPAWTHRLWNGPLEVNLLRYRIP